MNVKKVLNYVFDTEFLKRGDKTFFAGVTKMSNRNVLNI